MSIKKCLLKTLKVLQTNYKQNRKISNKKKVNTFYFLKYHILGNVTKYYSYFNRFTLWKHRKDKINIRKKLKKRWKYFLPKKQKCIFLEFSFLLLVAVLNFQDVVWYLY